jgi:CelD/BcsL family acetyltransferase involved in cellulose biosynthesis
VSTPSTSAIAPHLEPLRLQTVTTAQGLEALQDEWNPLLQRSRSNNMFLTFEWVSTWWGVYGDGSQLHVLTARDREGRLVGLAPLKIVVRGIPALWRLTTVEFIGHGGDVTPEYLDIIAEPGYETAVVDAFADRLCDDPAIHALDLRPFAGDSINLPRLQARLEARGGHVRRAQESICPVMHLPDSPEAFMAGQSRNYRKKIKECERKCERDLHPRLRLSRSSSELREDLGVLADLHRRRWSGETRAFQSAQYLAFHDRLSGLLLERGWMRMFTLQNGQPFAVLYCFAYGGRYYYYQAGRHPGYPKHRLGFLLMHKVIEEAIKERASLFDFLSGDEPYKYHWARTKAANVRLRYARNIAFRIAFRLNGVWSQTIKLAGLATSAAEQFASIIGGNPEVFPRL